MTNLVNNAKPNINTIISPFPYPSVFLFYYYYYYFIKGFSKKFCSCSELFDNRGLVNPPFFFFSATNKIVTHVKSLNNP